MLPDLRPLSCVVALSALLASAVVAAQPTPTTPHATPPRTTPPALTAPSPTVAPTITVSIPAAPSVASPLVAGPLTCSHGALRSLAVSDWWSRMTPVCARLTSVLPHRFEAPSGVPDPMFDAIVSMCAEGTSARAVCGLDAYRRELLITRVTALADALPSRLEGAQRLCGEAEMAAAIAPSAPEAVRAEVVEAAGAESRFCARDESMIPTARQIALARLAREVSVAAARANLTPEMPAATALWATLSSGPGRANFVTREVHGASDRGVAEAARESDSARGESAGSGGIGGLGGGIPSPAGLVEVALRGIADLLQTRAQAELEGFMLDQLREVICDGAAGAWFEYTCAYLVAPDAALRISAGSALRTAFRADVMAFPRRIAARAPMDGDARTMLGTLWFKLLGGATESRTLVDIPDRFADVGGNWTCAQDREPALCERTRKAVQGTGLLLAFAIRREDLGTLPTTMYHALAETVFDRGLSTDALGEVEQLRSSLLEYGETFRHAAEPQRTPAGRIPRVAAVLGGLRPVFARGVAVCFFDDRNAVRVTLAEGLPETFTAFMRADLVEVAVQAQRAVTVILPLSGLPPDVLRGMILAAEIAQARTPDQIRGALEAVVSPPGAWRLKRRRMMLSITGLVGVSGGGEMLLASGISGAGLVPSVGLVGALGLDVSFPVRSSTLGVYVSVLDLGGLLSIPLGDSIAKLRGADGVERQATLDVTSRISIEQVLAPGVYFRWGIGRSPFVFAAGASMIPFGRTVQEVRTDGMMGATFSTDASVLRVSAVLGVDLTLFPF